MNKELFFDGMLFMDLYNVSFMIHSISAVVVNDPFFKSANVSAPLFGQQSDANKIRKHSNHLF